MLIRISQKSNQTNKQDEQPEQVFHLLRMITDIMKHIEIKKQEARMIDISRGKGRKETNRERTKREERKKRKRNKERQESCDPIHPLEFRGASGKCNYDNS